MTINFEDYIKEVKSQLNENCSEEYINAYITYTYNSKDVDDNLEYFKDCMKKELSPYKALLFFGDYLKEIK